MKVRTLRRRFYRAMGNPRRCKDFDPECINCLRFRFLSQHGRFPRSEEVWP